MCVLFHFNYEDHDKENKVTIIIEAATRLLPVHVDVKQLEVITFENNEHDLQALGYLKRSPPRML